MKNLLTPPIFLLCIILAIYGCSKGNDNYSVTDHTVGMVKMRTWSGYAFGNAYGDTVLTGTTHIDWPKPFDRTITDTVFSVQVVNGFAVSVKGVRLIFRSVDSVTKMVRFDSTYASSANSFLIWDFGQDTIHFEYHRIFGYSNDAMKYFETNEVLSSLH